MWDALDVVFHVVSGGILVFFFLKDKDLIFEWIGRLLPEERGLAIRVWE